MLGFISERVPKTGALGLALMGGAGQLATSIALPIMGRIYDRYIAAAVPAGTNLEALRNAAPGTQEAAQWIAAQQAGGSATLRYMALLPAALIVLFLLLIVEQRGKAAVRLEAAGAAAEET